MRHRAVALSATLLAVAAFPSCREAPATPNAAEAVPLVVRTAVVERRDLVDTVVLSGSLRPRAQVEVVAEVAGRLARVLIDEGARVHRGEVLAILDDTDYRLGQAAAQAAYRLAEANRDHAEAEKARAKELLRTGGITDQAQLAAGVNLAVGDASLARAKAELDIAGVRLARTRILAPFDGRVARRHADAGAMLAAGQPLFTVVDVSRLGFRAPAPSNAWSKIRAGAKVVLSLDALGGRQVPAEVARVTPLVDERTRSFEVVVDVAGSDDLAAGLFARARVEVARAPGALVVPPSALLRDPDRAGEAQVFTVVNGRAERKILTLGIEVADAVQVTAGLEDGAVVVLDPPSALASGARVTVAPVRPSAVHAPAGK